MARKGIRAHTLARLAKLSTPASLYRFLKCESDMTAGNLEKVLDTLRDLPDMDEQDPQEGDQ